MKIHNRTRDSAQMVTLMGDDWLVRQRIAGKTVATVLSTLEALVRDKTTFSLRELNAIAEKIIEEQGCEPTFKGYKGHNKTPFPAGVCMSVNKQLVHGIPTDYHLQDGDLISFDLGATYEGAIADAAITCCYGEYLRPQHKEVVLATRECLLAGIRAVKVGNRLGAIGHAISKKAQEYDLGLVTEYGGHGLSWDRAHAPPFVSNRAAPTDGIMMQKGLTIAIEPQMVIGSPRTRISADGWSVVTEDIGAHWEHSLYLHDTYVEIITLREGEVV